MKLVSLLCAVALVANAPRARQDPAVVRAEAAFAAEQWADAARGFQSAYESDPQLDYLFAWAQAERFDEHCERAVELYTTYLEVAQRDAQVTPEQLEKVEDLRELCREQLAAQQPPPPPAIVAPPPTLRPDDSRRRWYQDPLGGALVGVGTGVLLAGLVVRGVSSARSDNAALSNTEGAFESEYADARKLGTAGVVLLSTGAAIAFAGVVRWIVLARRDAQ